MPPSQSPVFRGIFGWGVSASIQPHFPVEHCTWNESKTAEPGRAKLRAVDPRESSFNYRIHDLTDHDGVVRVCESVSPEDGGANFQVFQCYLERYVGDINIAFGIPLFRTGFTKQNTSQYSPSKMKVLAIISLLTSLAAAAPGPKEAAYASTGADGLKTPTSSLLTKSGGDATIQAACGGFTPLGCKSFCYYSGYRCWACLPDYCLCTNVGC
ncbi:hypothetical protein FQN57_003245 [Myotisia sp. PD_48]|nr:hypothetical protein FQN57_003245 [Myotisia sp. PD_48]